MGIWESSGTPENSEFDYRGQKTLPWGDLYTIGKVLKCRCQKWARMSHSNICSTSNGWKKGPLKVENWPNPSVWRWSATHRSKALKARYKFASDLIPIRGLTKELWMPKVLRVQTGTVLGLLLGSPGKKCHLNVGAIGKHREYYMGEGGGFPWVWAMMNHVSLGSPVACLSTLSAPECKLTNLLVGLM
jgi:hypothetical protein